MRSKAKSLFSGFFGVEPEERLKILFLSIAFFALLQVIRLQKI